ncbi:acyl-CoA dehydrogenase C-terminal domain-containing protein [Marinobacter sp. OP 3.4]|uniref:acyl-CoA dehydrogenase C-terminal domain-containing protein n=1 Tax=Marinobacter sp. OP 3.4 TaxID=3076501 RepID=UPI002E1FA0C4
MVASQVESREFLFQLFDILDTGTLVSRDRYQAHSDTSLRTVVETFSRLSAGRSGAGDDHAQDLAEGSGGVVPEVVLTLGNGLYEAAGQPSRLFRTRSEELVAGPMTASLAAWRGYLEALAPLSADALDSPDAADLRGRLLAAKSRCEAALSMCLYGASLAEDTQSHPDLERREACERLLAFLQPLIAWWPHYAAWQTSVSLGNSDAPAPDPADVSDYARDFLGQRVWQHQSHGLQLFLQVLQKDLEAATTQDTQQWALSLSETLQRAVKVTQGLGQGLQAGSRDRVLANAARYLHLFGEMLAGWMWLRQANAAAGGLASAEAGDEGFYRGKLQAARYFFHWTLPEVAQDLVLLQNQDTTCLDMRAGWF